MAVVIPIRFASADPGRRDRIVGILRDNGIDVRRSDVKGLGVGELYLLRANTGLAARHDHRPPRAPRAGLAGRGRVLLAGMTPADTDAGRVPPRSTSA